MNNKLYSHAKSTSLAYKMLTRTMIITNDWNSNFCMLKKSGVMKDRYQHQHDYLISMTFPKNKNIKKICS